MATRDYQTEFRNRLIESRLTPNAISLTGFTLCVVSAVLILQGWWIAGGIAFIVGSVCDTLDGRYSRMSGKGSPFGAFLDSTLDRLEEGIVLAAVAYRIVKDPDLTVIAGPDVAVSIVVLAVLASLMVSYTRARAEALGVECKVGIADRAVRVVVLSAGASRLSAYLHSHVRFEPRRWDNLLRPRSRITHSSSRARSSTCASVADQSAVTDPA